MTNEELINKARSYLNPHKSGDRLFGDVASTLITENGTLFSGVCIDTGSGTGFCAEAAAIGAMVTSKEYRIRKIVAVWADGENKSTYVLPPCGRCREFMRQIDEDNLSTEVVIGTDEALKLSDLLPCNQWPEAINLNT